LFSRLPPEQKVRARPCQQVNRGREHLIKKTFCGLKFLNQLFLTEKMSTSCWA